MNTRLKKYYPWVIWALSSSFLFYKYLLQVSPSVMVDELMRTFSLSGASMGNLAAYYFYAYLAMQLPVGILLDRYSPRNLVSCAIAVCACGALIFAHASSLGIAEFGRLLIGLGGAFSAVGTMKLITLWFPPKRFAYVSGLMMTVGMLGAVGGEAPLAQMVASIGWRETLFLGALIGIALAMIMWICVRDSGPYRVSKSQSNKTGKLLIQIKALVRNPQTWLISIYSGLAFAPISAFAGLWGVPYLMSAYPLSRIDIAGLVSLTFIGFAIGAPFAGWLSDKIKRRKPIMATGTLFGMIALLCVLYIPLPSAFVLGSLLLTFGFFTSFFFVSFATVREINHPDTSGTAIGFINMFNALCGAFSEPLIGKLLDEGWGHKMHDGVRFFSTHDYNMALILLPVCMIASLVLLFFVKETHCVQSTG